MFTKILSILMLGTLFVAAEQKPNIIFILADDMGYGGIKYNGTDYLETPNIDSLAKSGMNFTNGIANYPTCKPSRAAIISGQYAPRTGVYRVSNKHKGSENLIRWQVPECLELKKEQMTIGKVMKKAGYATAMYGKWHVANQNKPEGHPMAFGFDDAIVSSGAHYKFKSTPEVDCPDDVSSTEYFTDKAIEFMDKAQKEKKPFFLFLPFFLVHGPQDCRADYIAHFKKKLAHIEYDRKKEKDLPTLAAMTKLLDDCVGKLNKKVADLGIEKNTLIIFTSDNGSYMQALNGDFREKKGQVYEGGMRVPYIFKWPAKIAPGASSDQRICGLDLLPTLAAIGGIDVSSETKLDGISLVDHLSGQEKELAERSVYCVYPKYARFNKKTKRWGDSWRHVLYQGDYKLIEYPEYAEFELFNLKEDLQEKKELSKSKPEKLQALNTQLQAWLKKMNSPKLIANPGYKLEK